MTAGSRERERERQERESDGVEFFFSFLATKKTLFLSLCFFSFSLEGRRLAAPHAREMGGEASSTKEIERMERVFSRFPYFLLGGKKLE